MVLTQTLKAHTSAEVSPNNQARNPHETRTKPARSPPPQRLRSFELPELRHRDASQRESARPAAVINESIGTPPHLSLPCFPNSALSLSRGQQPPGPGKNGTSDQGQNMKMLETPSTIFIGRWTPRILFSLKDRPHRYGELRRVLESVSQRMLTRTLRNLESTGLIARRVTKSRTISVEYSLTQLGRTIIFPLRGMCRWAKRYSRQVSADVHLPDAGSPAKQSSSSGR